jgi:hypothetical protein
MKFEYVKPMSEVEKSDYFNKFSQANKNKSSQAFQFLSSIENKLVAQYEKVDQNIFDNYKKDVKEYYDKLKAWETKTCQGCKSKLNKINGDFGAFWGCPNFRNNEVIHSKFSLNQEEYLTSQKNNIKPRIHKDWATDIKKELQLPNYITATNIIDFLEYNGYEDLRAKYNYKATKESISGFVNANKDSKKEEKEVYEKLEQKNFKKLHKQYYIKYKKTNESEKVAILDILLSNENKVYIIEIKRFLMYANDEQLDLYYNLISHILGEKKDNREVKPLFCISNKEEYDLKYYQPKHKFIYANEIDTFNF